MMNERTANRESGFTLIELMVVVLIIAILIAIAIPTFLGMRERAWDADAKSNLRNGLSAAVTYFTDNESYVSMDATALNLSHAPVQFVDVSVDCVTGVTGDDSLHGLVLVQDNLSDGTACLSVWTKGSDRFYYWTADSSTQTLVIR